MRTLSRTSSAQAAILTSLCLSLGASWLRAADWNQWRGPHRDGISSETGLLQQWPAAGPTLLWQVQDLGSGYSTPAVVGESLYLLANEGLDNEFVQAHDTQKGQRAWRTRLGKVGNPDQDPKFPAARSTPTVDGDQLFALGSDGDLACIERRTGTVRWQKNLRADFGGKPGTWAYAESPLVDGDIVLCTPGGAEATLVALNKKTGAVVWKSALPDGDAAAYASAIVVEAGGIRQYVQMLQKGLVGVDATTGKQLWRYAKTVSRFNANIPTPVAKDGRIFSAGAGTGGGLVQLKVNGGTVEPEQVYFAAKLPTAIGGSVLMGGHLYGTGGQGMLCVEFATGTLKWEERGLGVASLCYADGRLYLQAESGEVGLLEPAPDGYREKGRFTPPNRPGRINAMEKAWTYPVVSGGRLYLRDHGMLWCYDIRATR